jgi:hypothetical protein
MAKNSDIAVAIFPTRESAEMGVNELEESGVDMKSLSIIWARLSHRGTGRRLLQPWRSDEGVGQARCVLGGLWGASFGGAFFMIPGIGPLVLVGPIVSWQADQFVLTLHGTPADVDRARSILQRTGARETAIHPGEGRQSPHGSTSTLLRLAASTWPPTCSYRRQSKSPGSQWLRASLLRS